MRNQGWLTKVLGGVLAGLLLGCCLSCGGNRPVIEDPYFKPSETERLTQGELDGLKRHAREIVLESKKLMIDDECKSIVRNTEPYVRLAYTAPRYGRLAFEWQVKNNALLQISVQGRLEGRQMNWRVRIVASHEVVDTPGPLPGLLRVPASSIED